MRLRARLPVAPIRAALLSLAVLACAGPGASPASPPATSATAATSATLAADPVELTVFGAASLRDALTRAADQYQGENPNVRLRLAFDASSALRSQIEQGAPVDVFASADTQNPQALVDHGLAAGPVSLTARNELVIVVPRSTEAPVATPLDLARRGVKVIAAGPEVPITTYTTQLLAQLAGLPGYPSDFAARVNANVVSREDNVRAIVAKVALGEGDAGVVYATDARGANVGTMEIPAGANVVATYGAVAVSASSHPAEARAFLDWLVGPRGQAVLAALGFPPAGG
jgi:molybdate transport system substrate-binding protein